MLRVTWEWLGLFGPALDVANTVALSDGEDFDLLEPQGAFERWATEAAARQARLESGDAAVLIKLQPELLRLRSRIREVFSAAAAGEPLPAGAVAELNRASRAVPRWRELNVDGTMRERSRGNARDRLMAEYARSAMEIAAEGALRVCPAPSCGMYFEPGRRDQRWCSTQCGTRARVARHAVAAGRR